MSLQMIRKRQTDTLTWGASSTVSADLDVSGAVTEIILRASITASGSMAASEAVDGIWRVIQNLSIEGAGAVSYFSMGDEQIGRMLHLLNMHDRTVKGVGREPLATTNDFVFVIHFGSRPHDMYGRRNRFDLSAFVPAFDDSKIKIKWGTTANNVMGTGITISSGTMYVTVCEVLGKKADILREMARQGVREPMVAVSSYQAYAHQSAKSDFSLEFDVPTEAFLRRVVVMAQDATATRPLRTNSQLTQLALKLPVGNQRIIADDIGAYTLSDGPIQSDLVADNATTGGAVAVGNGFAVLDLREHYDPDYGADLRGLGTGKVKLGATIGAYSAGDDSFYWWDQVRPYKM